MELAVGQAEGVDHDTTMPPGPPRARLICDGAQLVVLALLAPWGVPDTKAPIKRSTDTMCALPVALSSGSITARTRGNGTRMDAADTTIANLEAELEFFKGQLRLSSGAVPRGSKVCCVAGVGEGGIGEHVAAKFASQGYSVAMLARRKEVPHQ